MPAEGVSKIRALGKLPAGEEQQRWRCHQWQQPVWLPIINAASIPSKARQITLRMATSFHRQEGNRRTEILRRATCGPNSHPGRRNGRAIPSTDGIAVVHSCKDYTPRQ